MVMTTVMIMVMMRIIREERNLQLLLNGLVDR